MKYKEKFIHVAITNETKKNLDKLHKIMKYPKYVVIDIALKKLLINYLEVKE